MQKTPPGTRALIRKYLKDRKEEDFFGGLWIETEIAKRITPENAVVVDGKVITAYKGEIKEGTTSYWIFIHDRIGLDNEDDQIPTIKTPYEEIEEEDFEEKKLSEES